MVSVLTKIFGPENLETAEDVVQDTLLQAMQIWKLKGVPENPSAWLFRVAKNKAIDIIRRNKHSVQYDFNDSERALLKSEYTLAATMDSLWKEELVKDDLLRMMFACCHPGISQENQVTLILKTLCGFSTAEIAKTFLSSEDTVSKRLYRAKEFFREHKIRFELPPEAELKNRTGAVLNAIYLLFNEAYNSTHSEAVIRKDLMDEAMALCRLLTENRLTQLPETYALMALMCFHASRNASRLTDAGEIILLPRQDRSKWNTALIDEGNEYMNLAASGDQVSSYHIEAAIAYEHCSAESFDKTDWRKILGLYDWLCRVAPSPIAELNKAVAVMEVHGPAEALKALLEIPERNKMESFYLFHSLLGEVYYRLNNFDDAKKSLETAIRLTQSDAEKKILRNKLAVLLN
ncbi:MAG: RNA polymerase sigma-70 factor, ECF subfamily [Bacteroidetes bacterium]|nr:MAG: RNA polymerase sigma-70 factor, ECF subfamily [Bacteroidota bacterium]